MNESSLCYVSCGCNLELSTCNVFSAPQIVCLLTETEQQQQQHLFNGPLSWTTCVSQYQKDKTNLDLLEHDT